MTFSARTACTGQAGRYSQVGTVLPIWEEGMSIYRLLASEAFEAEHIAALSTAFEQTLAALSIADRTDPLSEMVAKKIIELGQQGVPAPAELRARTVRALTT